MESEIADAVRAARADGGPVEVAGAGSVLACLPDPPSAGRVVVGEHRGIVSHEAEDLTVVVRAGTRVGELDEALAEAGQECPIEGLGSTVGGRVSTGLSGVRALGAGPVREWVLGGRLVTDRGEVVRFGGRTVKNVTGYDLSRLLCGSWGTLGILTELTLRLRPRPRSSRWYVAGDADRDLGSLAGPGAVVRTRTGTHVLLEGHPEDCAEQAHRFGLAGSDDAPRFPAGVRISVPPGRMDEVLPHLPGDYAAELRVGIIHADPGTGPLGQLRRLCESMGGRLLVLDRSGRLPVFGEPGPAGELSARVKRSLDPDGLFAPWRFSQ